MQFVLYGQIDRCLPELSVIFIGMLFENVESIRLRKVKFMVEILPIHFNLLHAIQNLSYHIKTSVTPPICIPR